MFLNFVCYEKLINNKLVTIMDACDLEYPENCFDLIIDKGTFDCMLCGDSSFEKASSMINVKIIKSFFSFYG